MPKVNVYLPDRLAEAVRRYEIPVSAACQRALEQEVAARLPFLELTPRARDVLGEASVQAGRLGQNFVGVEHLMLAILDNPRSLAAQVIEALGMTERLRAELHAILSQPPPPSNRVADHEGNILGYLFEGRGVVSLDGKTLRVVTDDAGRTYGEDAQGKRQPTVPQAMAPHLVALDSAGSPVIVIDENGRHTGKKAT